MKALAPTIKAVQQAVGVTPDGIAGPLTWAAIAGELKVEVRQDLQDEQDSGESSGPDGELDERSERNIENLNPVVVPMARQLIHRASIAEIDARILSGFRSYEEQAALYADYKAGGPRAAPPGRSNHNFGLAFDVGIFDSKGRYIDEFLPEKQVAEQYQKLGKIGKELGLLWGGDWSGDSDMPHFEFRPEWASNMSESEALAAYRKRAAEGTSLV